MGRKGRKENRSERANVVVGKPLRGKVHRTDFLHLAWKSAKPADSHFSTATTATDVSYQGNRRTQKTNPTSSEINLLQQKNGLDLGVHHRKSPHRSDPAKWWQRPKTLNILRPLTHFFLLVHRRLESQPHKHCPLQFLEAAIERHLQSHWRSFSANSLGCPLALPAA